MRWDQKRGSVTRAVFALAAIAVLTCYAQAADTRLTVGSKTFAAGATLPDRVVYNAMSCNGQNLSPELHWSQAPKGTKSFAITAWDPDAPAPGGWWHWVLYDIPAGVHAIAEGRTAGASGTTSFRATGYDGPCPPPGMAHHYRFTVYALNVVHVGAGEATTGPELLTKMHGHVLAQGLIVGLYKR